MSDFYSMNNNVNKDISSHLHSNGKLSNDTTIPKKKSRYENVMTKVLVIYTGGTIGMIKTSKGVYAPMPDVFKVNIRRYPQLHDSDYIFNGHSSIEEEHLILPATEEAHRVLYRIEEYSPLLDSSNMTMNDWIRLAQDIKKNYETYDGFVILHGTDTMAYTASALSFMLENLGKTVIITGSQIPVFEPRSDGLENLLDSLIIAGNYIIPEVLILFNNNLYRGNRTSKVNTASLDAFSSPNMRPLATVGIKIQIDWKNVFPSQNIEKFRVHPQLNKNVSLLRLFPSITVEVVRAFLSPPIEGVVLQTYGAGNGPTERKDLLDEFKRATRRGVIILNCTQCIYGQVNSCYETGSSLLESGVIFGSDLTPEAALTKLSYVLSKTELSLQAKRMMMQTNLRGEMTIIKDTHNLEHSDILSTVMQTLRLSSNEEQETLKDVLYPAILCRYVAEGDLEKIEILRQFGVYMSTCDYDYRTPLHIASAHGNCEVIQYLLSHGASVHMRDREHRTPIMIALECNNQEAIQLLMKAGAYLNLPSKVIGDMYCQAAKTGDLDRLKSLMLAEASVNEVGASKRTALHSAIEADQVQAIERLLEMGADCCTIKDVYGHNPHDTARVLGHAHIIELLDKTCPNKISV